MPGERNYTVFNEISSHSNPLILKAEESCRSWPRANIGDVVRQFGDGAWGPEMEKPPKA